MRRTHSIALLLLAGTLACTEPGQGLNYGCGPGDPCCAAGTWTFTCPETPASEATESSCQCDFSTAKVGPFSVSPTIAHSGGTVTVGTVSLTFDVATCSITAQTTCKTPIKFYFSSSGATIDFGWSCINTSTQACLGECGQVNCTATHTN